jgi:hypothetical protein
VSVAIILHEPALVALSNVNRFSVDVAPVPPCPMIVNAGFVLFIFTLFENVVNPDTFKVDKHVILFIVNAPDIVLSPDVNAAAVIPDQLPQRPASSKYLIDKIGLAVFLGRANCAP